MKSSSPSGSGGVGRKLAARSISYTFALFRHWRLFSLLVLFALMGGLTFFVYTKSVYYSKSLVRFRILNSPIKTDDMGNLTNYSLIHRSLMEQLRSRYLLERTAKRIGLVATTGTFDTIRSDFVKALTVSPLDSNTLLIEVFPYYPELAEIWTDAMVDEFHSYQSELRSESQAKMVGAYLAELGNIERKIEENIQKQLDFERESQYTAVKIRYSALEESLRDRMIVDHNLRAADQAVESLKDPTLSRLERLSRLGFYRKTVDGYSPPRVATVGDAKDPIQVSGSRPPDAVIIPSREIEPDAWQILEQERIQLEQRVTEESKTFGPENEKIIALQKQLILLDNRISSEAETAMSAFEDEVKRLKEKKLQLEALMPEFEQVKENYVRIQQKYRQITDGQDAWKKAYEELKKKIEAIDFSKEPYVALDNLGIEMIREDPVSPNKMQLILASLALGLALGVGIPFAMERFNDTASRIEEIEQAFDLQGLGIVPITPRNLLENIVRSPEIDASIPDSLLENFRVIRSGIALNKDMPLGSQVMMVTSSLPSEGKTTLACNLGWAFASIQGRTLIIDSDLRRGRVHDVLDVSNEVGLSDVLHSQATLEQAIQCTKVPNLSVITRGRIIPGATEHMCTVEHERTLERLRQDFDHIIMDCPPVLGLSETSSLMRLVDGVVFTIRAERTTHRDINAALTLLRKAGGSFYGFVLNGLDLSKLANYHNYYYYSPYYYVEMVESAPRPSRVYS